VYSEADRESLLVRFADEDVCIGPAPARDSDLKMPRIIAAAEDTGAERLYEAAMVSAERTWADRLAQMVRAWEAPPQDPRARELTERVLADIRKHGQMARITYLHKRAVALDKAGRSEEALALYVEAVDVLDPGFIAHANAPRTGHAPPGADAKAPPFRVHDGGTADVGPGEQVGCLAKRGVVGDGHHGRGHQVGGGPGQKWLALCSGCCKHG